MAFEIDAIAGTPNLWFAYPSALPQAGGYVAKRVNLEFGALTRQQPTGEYSISPMLATTLGATYDDFECPVVALELSRTFWEKATILHAEYEWRRSARRDRDGERVGGVTSTWQSVQIGPR